MVFAFDTLGYSKRLRDGGVPNNQAETHAEAARDFIMTELAIKADVQAVKTDVLAVRAELGMVKSDLRSDMAALKTELMTVIETVALRQTIRLGSIVIAGAGVIVACIGVLAFFLRLR